ncbi:MAG: cation:proton antiporter [Candidatus Nanohaloarchaea archaeon]
MEIISTLTAIFVAASVTLLIFDKFNHPAIPAYIIAGLTVGYFIDSQSLMNLAQIGIAFLVFIFGLKFDPKRLKDEARTSLNATTVQILLTSFIAYSASVFIGYSSFDSAVFAIAAGLSSSLIGLELAEKEIQFELLHGRIAESMHMIQDIIGLLILGVIFASGIENAVYSLGITVGMLAFALVLREFAFDFIAKQADFSSELMMLSGLTALVGFISVTQFFEIPMAIGAFAAGLTAAKFPHNMELLDTMGSIKDFFSAVFFVALGALVTFPTLGVLSLAALLVFFTSFVNPYASYKALKIQGYDSRTSMLASFPLDQISEITLIIAIQASILGLLSNTMFQAVLLAGVMSMMISSYTKKYEEELYQMLKPEKKAEDPLDIEDHVIIVGHHIQGKRILEHLQEEGVKVAVIDNDPEKVSETEEKGVPAVYGDIMDQETWIEANYTEAQLIVSTVPSKKVSEKILDLEKPEDKIVRASDPWEAVEHMENGAIHAVVPDIAASELLIDHIEGVMHHENYREELRRKSLLEVREYLESR